MWELRRRESGPTVSGDPSPVGAPHRPERSSVGSRHKVGAVDDPSEREAGRIAGEVAALLAAPGTGRPDRDMGTASTSRIRRASSAPPFALGRATDSRVAVPSGSRIRRSTSGLSPVADPGVIRRSPESKKKMTELAAPVKFELKGEDLEVQDALATKLSEVVGGAIDEANTEATQLGKQWKVMADAAMQGEQSEADRLKMGDLDRTRSAAERKAKNYGNVTHIGSIVLTRPAQGGLPTLSDLVAHAALVDLPPKNDTGPGTKHALDYSTYDLVVAAGLSGKVVQNTLSTMHQAGQLDYLRKAGLPNDDFDIVIEVHYYYNRGAGETNLHKDTAGETLFVNLNFLNKAPMLGPEYILNPRTGKKHDAYVRKKLPKVFVDDLEAAKSDVGPPNEIGATTLGPNGVVAFVDEMIHHKTPEPGRRTASARLVVDALKKARGNEYDDAKQAYEAYNAAAKYSLWTWSTYLKTPGAKKASAAWWSAMEGLEEMGKDKQDRTKLATWLVAPFDAYIDGIIEASAANFTTAGLPHDDNGERKTKAVRVQKQDRPPLKRQMSGSDLQSKIGDFAMASQGKRRSFFRTWVRAVPHV